jgi:hypothetical protein
MQTAKDEWPEAPRSYFSGKYGPCGLGRAPALQKTVNRSPGDAPFLENMVPRSLGRAPALQTTVNRSPGDAPFLENMVPRSLGRAPALQTTVNRSPGDAPDAQKTVDCGPGDARRACGGVSGCRHQRRHFQAGGAFACSREGRMQKNHLRPYCPGLDGQIFGGCIKKPRICHDFFKKSGSRGPAGAIFHEPHPSSDACAASLTRWSSA